KTDIIIKPIQSHNPSLIAYQLTYTMSKHAFYKIYWRDMDWYDNIFDVMDDNEDVLEYTPQELNRFYKSAQFQSNIEEDPIDDEQITEDVDMIFLDNHTDHAQPTTAAAAATEKEDDQDAALSQRFSQLSTEDAYEQLIDNTSLKRRRSTSKSVDVISKRFKLTPDNNIERVDIKDDFKQEKFDDDTPAYLSLTNTAFLRVIKNIQAVQSTFSATDLQTIATSMHHIAALRLRKHITHLYLRSGTGKLGDPNSDLNNIDWRVWPAQVKLVMSAKHAQSNISMNDTINAEDEHLECENLVTERLEEIKGKDEQYNKQLEDKRSQLIGFTSAVEDTIIQYVQRYGIIPLQMKTDLKIALLKHDYNATILQRKYERENPNEYQIQVAQRLCTARHKLEQSKRELIELKQRVFYYKFPSGLKDIGASPSLLTDSTTAYSTAHHKLLLEDKHEKIYQREKLDSLVPHVIRAEIRYHQADDKFNVEYTTMLNNHRNLVRNKGMTTALSSLLEQRLSNITDRLRDIHYYRINFLLRSSYGDLENTYKQTEPNQQANSNTFLSNVISDTMHGLTMKQIQLLSRGPCYVPPCQSRLLSSSSNLTSTSVVDIVKKQYAPLKHQIAGLLSKHRINIVSSWDIHSNLHQKFTDLFAISIPHHVQQRT
ncbi:unnamed protein product, partial [Adineta ricciae]